MQFQFSVCMYGTCGRIDNKADFDFDLTLKVQRAGLSVWPANGRWGGRVWKNWFKKVIHFAVTHGSEVTRFRVYLLSYIFNVNLWKSRNVFHLQVPCVSLFAKAKSSWFWVYRKLFSVCECEYVRVCECVCVIRC